MVSTSALSIPNDTLMIHNTTEPYHSYIKALSCGTSVFRIDMDQHRWITSWCHKMWSGIDHWILPWHLWCEVYIGMEHCSVLQPNISVAWLYEDYHWHVIPHHCLSSAHRPINLGTHVISAASMHFPISQYTCIWHMCIAFYFWDELFALENFRINIGAGLFVLGVALFSAGIILLSVGSAIVVFKRN